MKHRSSNINFFKVKIVSGLVGNRISRYIHEIALFANNVKRPHEY